MEAKKRDKGISGGRGVGKRARKGRKLIRTGEIVEGEIKMKR